MPRPTGWWHWNGREPLRLVTDTRNRRRTRTIYRVLVELLRRIVRVDVDLEVAAVPRALAGIVDHGSDCRLHQGLNVGRLDRCTQLRVVKWAAFPSRAGERRCCARRHRYARCSGGGSDRGGGPVAPPLGDADDFLLHPLKRQAVVAIKAMLTKPALRELVDIVAPRGSSK